MHRLLSGKDYQSGTTVLSHIFALVKVVTVYSKEVEVAKVRILRSKIIFEIYAGHLSDNAKLVRWSCHWVRFWKALTKELFACSRSI